MKELLVLPKETVSHGSSRSEDSLGRSLSFFFARFHLLSEMIASDTNRYPTDSQSRFSESEFLEDLVEQPLVDEALLYSWAEPPELVEVMEPHSCRQ